MTHIKPRILIVVAILSSITLAQDRSAVTEDGKKVILRANGTWQYAPEAEKKPTSNAIDEYRKAPEIITALCKAEWPENFEMQAYCEDKQQNAVVKLRKGKPAEITGDQYQIVHKACAKEWPKNYEMQAYCESKQFDAVRRLRDK